MCFHKEFPNRTLKAGGLGNRKTWTSAILKKLAGFFIHYSLFPPLLVENSE